MGTDQRKQWSKWDIVLSQAYQILENERCSQCGLPRYVCFAGETEVITKGGTKQIKDALGAQTLLTRDPAAPGAARWVEAEIRSFGHQPLMAVNLRRGTVAKTIYATAKHRWFTRKPVRMVGGVRDWKTIHEVTTDSLRGGDVLVSAFPQKASTVTISPIGVTAGFTFGDGTIQGQQARVDLFGSKDLALVPYFSTLQHNTVQALPTGCTDDSKRSFWGIPRSWKRLPGLDEGTIFLRSWLAGYFAADGSVGKNGAATISCASAETLEAVRDIATLCGLGTYAVRTYLRKGIGGSYSNLSNLTFMREHLSPEFFIIDEHRRRFENLPPMTRKSPNEWRVESVETTDRFEEVYCAVVPDTHAFVLKDNILTGNCGNDSRDVDFRIEKQVCYATIAREKYEKAEEKKRGKAKGQQNEAPPGEAVYPAPYLHSGGDLSTLRDPYYEAEWKRRKEMQATPSLN